MNLIVREVGVAPIRAYVGDGIRIDMAGEYWGDFYSDDHETTEAEVKANGKVVASSSLTHNVGRSIGDRYRKTFFRNTRGAARNTYRFCTNDRAATEKDGSVGTVE